MRKNFLNDADFPPLPPPNVRTVGVRVEFDIANDKHYMWINDANASSNKRFCHKNLYEQFEKSIWELKTFSQELCFDDEQDTINKCSRIHLSLEFCDNEYVFNVRTYFLNICKKTSIPITYNKIEHVCSIYKYIYDKIKKGYDEWYGECALWMFKYAR